MSTEKVASPDIKTLSAADRTSLCMIYTHRCLTASQLHRFYYAKDGHKETYTKKHLGKMIDLGYLTEVDYGKEEPALFLAAKGIPVIQKLFCLKTTKVSGIDADTLDLHWKAYDLMMEPLKINHQITLNEFALEFDEKASVYGVHYTYQDEKFVPAKDITSAKARPDGRIELPNATIFLETDMNTENQAALGRKWNCYRVFFNTKEEWENLNKKPVIILFILENVSYADVRRNTVLKSARAHFMDCLSDNLNLYIDTHQNLMNILFDKIIGHLVDPAMFSARSALEKQGYYFQGNRKFPNTDLPCYTLAGENKTGKLVLMDCYQYAPLFVLKKILTAKTNEMLTRKQLKQDVTYIVVIADETRLKNDLRIIGGYCFENVVFCISTKQYKLVKYNPFLISHEVSL